MLDPFAGIGGFTLPIAQAGATVTAVERTPAVFAYLVENVVRNGVTDSVETYRASYPEVVAGFAPEREFDRVVVGRHDAHEHLADTLAVLAPGGTAHVHATVAKELLPERPTRRVRQAAEEAGRTVDSTAVRRVGNNDKRTSRVVVDAVVA
ncbi:MAG: putative methyltransferase [halophilic archaeon J07HX64]|nr:MAG: putative methyltransferase [halophilic archaeon J07HX64]